MFETTAVKRYGYASFGEKWTSRGYLANLVGPQVPRELALFGATINSPLHAYTSRYPAYWDPNELVFSFSLITKKPFPGLFIVTEY